jgi:DNA polymerase III delta prime subunit
MNNQCLTEKYRPKKLSECVLPYRIKSKLEKWKNKMPMHLIFYGNAGTGKTSTAIALAKQLAENDYSIINASKNNSDIYINNYITRLMSGVSLYGGKRIIILDESDRLTENAQTSLRKPLEDYGHLCSVIFTNNYDNIIEPIKSRCFEFDFNIKQDEKDEFYKCLKRRLRTIIKKEDINISTKELNEIIKSSCPDIRKMVNQLELY